jgi:glycosyltransferase involved in cell wall biosynthesis
MKNRLEKQSLPEQSRKFLFLYFELAGYTVACIEQLATLYNAEIHVVKYPVNPVAPFRFTFSEGIKTYERNDYSTEELIALCQKINPDTVYVCGWSDKGYTAAAKSFRKKIPVILTLDNPWLGNLKQYIARIAGPLFLKRIFTHCWVPGEPNAKYARKLGFKNDHLKQGLYSADTRLFHGYYHSFREEKEQKFPHRFIFAGRYTLLKGVTELWNAFNSLSETERGDWELWCMGKGELESQFPEQPHIKNCGFIQPADLAPVLRQTGVFILPAHYEHWGVVVHEFAAAGFPLICSTTTSAATTFLKEGENGFFTLPKKQDSIRDVLIRTIQLSDKQLLTMSRKSVELADTITPTTWANTLWRIKGGA